MKVELGSMVLYYNSDNGFILAPETTIKGSIFHTTMDPVMVEKSNISPEFIGEKNTKF